MEQIFQVRKNVREGLKTDDGVVNDGIEHNIRDIRAILAVNAEILDRRMESRKQNENKHSGSVTFLRYSFDVVETYTISSETKFVTYPERSEKSFDTTPLSNLPADLDDILFFKHKDEPLSLFIDYESFFEKSLILHEDV